MRAHLDDQRRIEAHLTLPHHPPVLCAVKPGRVVVDVLDVDDQVGCCLLPPTISGSVGQAEALSLFEIQTRLAPWDDLIVRSTRSHHHLQCVCSFVWLSRFRFFCLVVCVLI